MKLTLISVASTVLALPLFAHAVDMPGMKMDGMDVMQMKQVTTQALAATADGAIKAIDTTKHAVTISYGAVPAVQ